MKSIIISPCSRLIKPGAEGLRGRLRAGGQGSGMKQLLSLSEEPTVHSNH